MRYFIPINKQLFEKAKKEQNHFYFVEVDETPISRFARYIQDYLFQQSGIYLSDTEIKTHEKTCLDSKKNFFDYYPSKKMLSLSTKKIHPIVNIWHRVFHTHGVRVTLTQKIDNEKNEPVILPALKQKIDELRQQSEVSTSCHLNNRISLIRDNRLFFTRTMVAQTSDGLTTHHVPDWANIVIVEDNNTHQKTTYVYDSQAGLNNAVFMYGLANHKIICSGIVKATTDKINEQITIPRLLFCPSACSTSEKKDTFNNNFLLYAMSLHAPINLGFVKTPSTLDPKTAYIYGGFSNDEDRQKADQKYDTVLEAIREKQRHEANSKEETQLAII